MIALPVVVSFLKITPECFNLIIVFRRSLTSYGAVTTNSHKGKRAFWSVAAGAAAGFGGV